MKNAVKKIAIYSMVGMMQIGFGASVIEASSLQRELTPMQQNNDRHDRHGQNDRDKDRHERERHERERQERERREREENRRHEREMRRRHHESDREWHERQEREKQRHDNTMNEIAAGIIGIIIGTQIN